MPYLKMTAEVLELLRARDTQCIEAVVRSQTQPLYRTARALGFNESEAEDLTQEAFRVFLETLDRFEGRSSVGTWLTGILYRKALERRRELARDLQHDPIGDILESRFDRRGKWTNHPEDLQVLVASRQLGLAIGSCLKQLPDRQRAVFLLRELTGMESSEICRALDIGASNLGVLLFRARNRLRECLEARGWKRE